MPELYVAMLVAGVTIGFFYVVVTLFFGRR